MPDAKKILSKSFMDNYENVNEDVAMQLIIEAEQKIRKIEEERAADEKLATAKQIVKDINSAYTNAIKYERAKINFFLEKIRNLQLGS